MVQLYFCQSALLSIRENARRDFPLGQLLAVFLLVRETVHVRVNKAGTDVMKKKITPSKKAIVIEYRCCSNLELFTTWYVKVIRMIVAQREKDFRMISAFTRQIAADNSKAARHLPTWCYWSQFVPLQSDAEILTRKE